MIDSLLARIFVNQWLVLVMATALLLGFAELGYRLGHIARRKNAEAAEGHSGAVQGAVLGLLGLLLGFSFAMAVGRYDSRRTLVVEEANSIGTTWLRADFLPSPHKEEVRDLLVRYTKLRIEKFAHAESREAMAPVRKEVAEIHHALWQQANDAAKAQPTPITASFITTLNETIDLDSCRMAALRNHVPGAVWLLLLIVAGCGSWASGYGSGTGGFRSSFSQLVFPILIGVVITLIVDIDRPQKGMIGVSQQPMQDLLESIQTNKP
ncbi:MAG: hypothetical protein ABI600_00920 [Luteolibacter sp.]